MKGGREDRSYCHVTGKIQVEVQVRCTPKFWSTWRKMIPLVLCLQAL